MVIVLIMRYFYCDDLLIVVQFSCFDVRVILSRDDVTFIVQRCCHIDDEHSFMVFAMLPMF